MEIDDKSDLLMVLIGLEAVSELLDSDERMTDFRRDRFAMLFNKVAESYNELVDGEDAIIVELLALGEYYYD